MRTRPTLGVLALRLYRRTPAVARHTAALILLATLWSSVPIQVLLGVLVEAVEYFQMALRATIRPPL